MPPTWSDTAGSWASTSPAHSPRSRSFEADLIDPKIAEHQGRIVKLTGDGMLVEFPSVVSAVACAAEIQRGMRARNADVPQERRIEFRIGVNLGDVIVEGDDIFGDGVNVAARLEGIAKPGGITVSGSVRDHVGNRLDLAFDDLGEQALKNIERPIHVYSVSLGKPAARDTKDAMPARQEQPERPSIAVLPFNNMSGDLEQEYFSDGITEDIITDLSKVSGLFVVARNTAFTYKGKPVKVQQVGRELGVNFLLEGSVRKAGAPRPDVTASSSIQHDGGHLWADRYDRDLTDIFAIQDEITHAIVEQLKIQLLPQEKKSIGQTPTDNVEAYTYYLRGRQFLHRHSKSYYELARRMFAKAVELDPLMHELTLELPIATPFSFCTTMRRLRSMVFSRRRRKRWPWRAGSLKHMPLVVWPCPLVSATRRQCASLNRPSRSMQIPSKDTTFMLGPVLRRAT